LQRFDRLTDDILIEEYVFLRLTEVLKNCHVLQ